MNERPLLTTPRQNGACSRFADFIRCCGGEPLKLTTYVYLTPNLDEAIWESEIAVGEGPGRVYLVELIGQVEDASELTGLKSPGYPSMSCCSRDPSDLIER